MPTKDISTADQPRMRADARRNYERLLAEAQAAFLKRGVDTSLDDIAKQAGVGNATLYRHFPTRESLLETLLRDSFLQLDSRANELMTSATPGEALVDWFRAAVVHATTYRGLVNALMDGHRDEASELNTACHAMQDSGQQLLARAQRAGAVRADTSPGEFFTLVAAAAWATENAPKESAQLVKVIIDGLRIIP